jgi:hypothetical protein
VRFRDAAKRTKNDGVWINDRMDGQDETQMDFSALAV